jgi:prepilin-type N-terminal cleavage/methylation domain-containing protein
MIRPTRTWHRGARVRGGFTLVEVLASLLLAAIVLPPAIRGIVLCLDTAGEARLRTEAAALAQSKLTELVATGEVYDAQLEGDFGEELPQYRWAAQLTEWEDSRLVQLDVAVTWQRHGRDRDVTLSTLLYLGAADE